MRLHGTAGGASGTLRRYGGVACRRYFQHLFSGPQINKVPERKASYLCLINEDVDHQQKQKIETPKNIYVYTCKDVYIYIYEQYIVIYIFLFNATSSCSVQPQHIHFLRYMKRVACMGRGPRVCMETTGGMKKKMAVFVGAHGGCFLFLGV